MVVYGIKIIAKVISVISVVSYLPLIAFPFIGMKMVKTILYLHERTLSYFVMQATWQQLLDVYILTVKSIESNSCNYIVGSRW